MPRQLRRDDYTVGWVCALSVELAAALEMLDEEHEDLARELSDNDNDENIYSLGSIGGHNVAIVCLPAGRIGNNPAAVVGAQMRATFKGIRFGLMVGIGGGVPSAEVDVRLGDVVVSQPDKTFGGVVQYDMGKMTLSGFERTGLLNSPPQILLSAVTKVRANENRGKSKLVEYMSRLELIPKFQRSKTGPDILFDVAYDHKGGQTCDKCITDNHEDRQPRESDEEVAVHYGTIASGNQVMKNAAERDRVSAELGGVLCFEMEAAGLMNSFPCLVIRGICDYADSHKNKRWQPYAAGTAAAYAKEVLSVIAPADVAKTRTAEEAIQSATRRAIYCIPFLKNRSFVGRVVELGVLKQKLMVKKDCRKMSVVGLGGTGKTQVTLQFAYTVKESWPDFSIFWVPALSMESYEQACVDIANTLGILQAPSGKEDAKELVRQHLSAARAGKWLLVVDNADDADIVLGTGQSKGIVDYLPQSEEGVVLFTTRTLEVAGELARGDVIELGAMDRQDAVDFLKKSLIKKDVLYDTAATEDLLNELTCLPLAIAQTAAYLNKNTISIREYLRLLQNTEQDIIDLMSREFRDDARYQGVANAVATTWVVSFSQIRARDEIAADLLSFISCIEWKAIPRSIFPSVQSEVRMADAIGTLCGYSFLVRRQDNNWYDIHRLVHLATRIWIRQRGDARAVAKRGIRHVVSIFPSDDYANRERWREYLPHAVRLLEDEQDWDVEEKSELALQVGRCLQEDGRIPEAVRWLGESCKHRAELYKEDHPSRLSSQHALAVAYKSHGQVKKAVKLLEQVVAIRKKVLAEDHPNQLASLHALAIAYESHGQVKKAVKLLEQVVAVRKKVLAEDDPNQLASQHALAIAYRADGQVKKAIELLEQVVALRKKVLAEDHPDQLASQHVLARAYQADGQVKKAIELLEQVVALRKKVLAEDHPDRLASQHALARAYLADGQVKKAIELLQYVVAVYSRTLRADHPSRLLSEENLAYMRAKADEQGSA